MVVHSCPQRKLKTIPKTSMGNKLQLFEGIPVAPRKIRFGSISNPGSNRQGSAYKKLAEFFGDSRVEEPYFVDSFSGHQEFGLNSRCVMLTIVFVLIALLTCPLRVHAEDTSDWTVSDWREAMKERSMEELGAPDMVSGMIRLVRDESLPWFTRRQAALQLGRVGEPAKAAIPVMETYINSTDRDEALFSLKSLALFGTQASHMTPAVVPIVLDESRSHLERISAMETLGRIGRDHELSAPTLIRMMQLPESDQQNTELRLAAAECLWMLGPNAMPALPELLRALRSDYPLVRLYSALTIGNIGPQSEIAVPALVDLILFDDEPDVREVAADALSGIGPPAVPALSQLIQDRDDLVRELAIRSLRAIRGPDVTQALSTGFHDDNSRIRVLAADALLAQETLLPTQSRQALDLLVGTLDDDDRQTRIAAYRALLKHATSLQSSHVTKLEKLAQHSESQVRTAASHLLKAVEFSRL